MIWIYKDKMEMKYNTSLQHIKIQWKTKKNRLMSYLVPLWTIAICSFIKSTDAVSEIKLWNRKQTLSNEMLFISMVSFCKEDVWKRWIV